MSISLEVTLCFTIFYSANRVIVSAVRCRTVDGPVSLFWAEAGPV